MFARYKQVLFSILLLATAAVWGISFMVMKDVQEIVPMNYILAIRFGVAAVGLAYFLYQGRDKFGWELLKHGFLVGTLLYLAYAVQSYGLFFTTVSKNAVYCCLNVVVVPFLAWTLYREKIAVPVYVGAVLCFVGVYFIAGPISVTSFNYGDLLSLASAVLFAAHIIAVSRCSRTSELLPLSCLQFLFASMWGWLFAIFGKPFPAELTWPQWGGLAWLAIMATLVAITMMNIGIKYISPTVTAVIFATECPFACMCGVWFKGDPITNRIALGIGLVFIALVSSQLGGLTSGSADKSKPNEDPQATPSSPLADSTQDLSEDIKAKPILSSVEMAKWENP